MELREFIEQRISEDEQWARAASAPYEYATGATAPEGGVHWTWALGENWEPTTVDPALDEWVGGEANYGCDVQLVTVEQWQMPNRSTPQYAANTIVEFRATWAGHIVRHDPARVLRDVAAKRRILEMWEDPADVAHLPDGVVDGRDPDERDEQIATASVIDVIVRDLAAVYAEHPDYRQEWSP